MGPLELVARLAAEPEHDPATLERMLGTPLVEEEPGGTAHYAVYRRVPEEPAWLSSVELRRARRGTASLLILTLDPSTCLTPKMLLAQYGEPEGLTPASPESHRRTTTYRYARGDDDFAFAFRPTAGRSCLVEVVIDRIRNRCVEVSTIRSNVQAHFGERIRLGIGNIWEGEYTNEAGAIVRGLSAGITVFVRDRPDETQRLRIGPGSRFQAGSEAFRVEDVYPKGAALCWLTPSSPSPRPQDARE